MENKINKNIIKFKTIINEEGYEENDLSEFLKNEGDMNYYLQGWLWSHFSVKHVFTLLGKKLETFEPLSNDEIEDLVRGIKAVLKAYFNIYYHQIGVLWGWLIERSPEAEYEIGQFINKHPEYNEIFKKIVDQLNIIDERLDPSLYPNGWSDVHKEILKELKIDFKKLIDLIHKKFYDEEHFVIPILVGIPKSDQIKLDDSMNSIMKDEPISRFIIGAIFDAAKTNKDLSDSINNTIPALVRNAIFPLAYENSYKWFAEFVSTTNSTSN